MISLFLGLTAANFLLLLGVFTIGLFTVDAGDKPTAFYTYHIALGIAAGLMTTLTHLAAYTYFMATSRWLQAATDKANLNTAYFALPALANKKKMTPVAMAPIVVTMLAMFAGAAADPTVRPWWPGTVHMAVAAVAIGANVFCAMLEYNLIRRQGRLMDGALEILNRTPGVEVASR